MLRGKGGFGNYHVRHHQLRHVNDCLRTGDGAGCRKFERLQLAGRAFSLDILFYRTGRFSIRKRLGSQITPTSEFSPHVWLTTQRDFQANMGKTAETHRPQALPYRQFGARTGFAVLPQVGRFSDSPSTCARLVDGRNLRNVRPHASSSVSLHIGALPGVPY